MDEFLSGCKDGYRPRESEGISKTAMDSFYDDGNQNLLQFHRLLSAITKIDHIKNVSELTQRANMLRDQILENRVLQNSDRKDPRTMILFWNTGTSYGLTPFRSDFIDGMECDILVKDVTKVNRVIGIGTNLHKFI